MMTHRGSCHCGKVHYEFEAEPDLVVTECNCSVCGKSGYLGVILPKERFRLLSDEADLSEYRFNTGTARHRFCRHCGVKSFYIPRFASRWSQRELSLHRFGHGPESRPPDLRWSELGALLPQGKSGELPELSRSAARRVLDRAHPKRNPP